MTRLVSLILAAALVAGPVRADGPPAPPPDHPARMLVAGQELLVEPLGRPLAVGPEALVVPPEGGIYLDPQAWGFQLEARRYLETRARAAEGVAEGQFLRGVVWGVSVGIAAGAVVAALVAR